MQNIDLWKSLIQRLPDNQDESLEGHRAEVP